jgi:hypothetical protein
VKRLIGVLCFAFAMTTPAFAGISAPPWTANPVTASPDDVNCNQGGNHLTLAACVAFWTASNIVTYIGDTHATSGIMGVRIQGSGYQGWWYSSANGGPANYGGIGSPNNTNFTGCYQGFAFINGSCTKVIAWPDQLPSYTPTIAVGGTQIPSGDIDSTNSYGMYQVSDNLVQVEEKVILTSTNGIPTGYPGWPIPVSSAVCGAAGVAQGQGSGGSVDGVIEVCNGLAQIQWGSGTWAYSTDFTKYQTWLLNYHYFIK